MDVAVTWAERLRDARSRRVVFLSHCLLNENTRYPGGATRRGAVCEVARACLDHGVGIVQLPCPEERAWGGVLKRRLLLFFGARGTLRAWLGAALLPLAMAYTRRVYRRLARQVAAQVDDYRRSGFTVVGIVGVDGSPSCGVERTVRVRPALVALTRLAPGSARPADVNAAVRGALAPGPGLFTRLLRDELDRRGASVPFTAHDLMAELEGDRSSAAVEALMDRRQPRAPGPESSRVSDP